MSRTANPTNSSSIPASDVVMGSIRPIWEKTIIEGELTLLVGHPGSGKSIYAHTIAAELSRRGIPSYLFSALDSRAVIASRLNAAKANRSLIFSPSEPDPILPDDMRYFEHLVKECHPKLVILDPLTMFTRLNLSYAEHCQLLLKPLLELAKQERFGILALGLLTKTGTPFGSSDFVGRCKSLLVVDEEFELNEKGRPTGIKTGRRLLRHERCTFSAPQPTKIFRIASETFQHKGQTRTTGKIVFLGEGS